MSLLTLLQSQSATQTITLNRVESTAQVFLPTVVQAGGTQTITLNRVESTAQVFLLTVTQVGSVQTIVLNRRESTAQVFLPTVVSASLVTDTSDILDRGLKRRNVLSIKEEENIAAQLLKARQAKKEIAKEKKAIIDWKKLISDAINGVSSLEELDAVELPAQAITSPTIEEFVADEFEKQKELKRLELEIATKELQAEIQKAKDLYTEIYNRYRIAEEAAVKAEAEAFLQAQEAERQYVEFKRQRDNRIKRLKALMWLAKIDL